MNKNIRILMIGPDMNSFGGMSSVIKLYHDSGLLDENVEFLSSYEDGSIPHKIFFFAGFLLKYFLLLLTQKNVKIIHLHIAEKGSFFRKAIICFISKLFHKKVILHLHGAEFNIFYNKVPKIIKKIITKTFNSADLVIVLSKSWENDILEKTSNSNIIILDNPIVIKEPNKIHLDKINILFMGRLGKRKGTYDILEAAKYINNPNVVINLYGDGNINEFEKLVINNNLQDKVKVNGWISGNEKEDIFKISDVLILPSYNEGLPIAILEAISYGLPVISTPVGGIPEAVKDGINGFLIQAGDVKTLAAKIDILASDEKLREKMGQESYKIAKERFDIKIIINQLQNIYTGML